MGPKESEKSELWQETGWGLDRAGNEPKIPFLYPRVAARMRDRRFAEFAVSQAMLNAWQRDAVLLSWAPVGKCRRVIGSFEESPPLLGLEPSTTHLSAHSPHQVQSAFFPTPSSLKRKAGGGSRNRIHRRRCKVRTRGRMGMPGTASVLRTAHSLCTL